jgi:hypothetical protein
VSFARTVAECLLYVGIYVGWEIMDPFIPIEVLPFTEGELDVMIDYYVHKK